MHPYGTYINEIKWGKHGYYCERFSIGFKLLFAFIIYGISFLLWSGIVARNELTYIVPISSAIVNILTVILGILIFKEHLTLIQIIGIGITVIGFVLMNWK